MLTRALTRYIRHTIRTQPYPPRMVDFRYIVLCMLRWRGLYNLIAMGCIGAIGGFLGLSSPNLFTRYALAPFAGLSGILCLVLALTYPFRICDILRRGQCCIARVISLDYQVMHSGAARMRPVTGTWVIESSGRKIGQSFRIERAWGLRLTVGSCVSVILPATPPYIAIPLTPLHLMAATDT